VRTTAAAIRLRSAGIAGRTTSGFPNATKGYGFIAQDGGGPDVFVHISAVEKAGYSGLAEGARVSYELFTGRNGKASAENLRMG
jgi:cold shock protein